MKNAPSSASTEHFYFMPLAFPSREVFEYAAGVFSARQFHSRIDRFRNRVKQKFTQAGEFLFAVYAAKKYYPLPDPACKA